MENNKYAAVMVEFAGAFEVRQQDLGGLAGG